jgi:predicted PurR-regulated permease PerM
MACKSINNQCVLILFFNNIFVTTLVYIVFRPLITHSLPNRTFLEDGKAQLQQIQAKLAPLADDMQAQLKPLAENMQAQLKPLVDNVQAQIEDLFRKVMDQTKALSQ